MQPNPPIDPWLPDELQIVNERPGDDDPLPDKSALEAELQRVFKSLDTNRNGRLEVRELQEALLQLGLPNNSSYVRDLMAQYDLNRDGEVEFEEFSRYVRSKERAMWRAFRRVDADRSGSLDREEVLAAFKGMGVPVDQRDAQRLIRLLDSDGDGRIDYGEFKRFALMLPGSQVTGGSSIYYAWIDSADWSNGMEYRLCNIPPTQPLERFIAGGVAGAVSRTAVAPLERLRTIMMADPNASRLLPTMRRIWADGGARGLFRGNLATVIKVFPSNAANFAVYDTVKDWMLHAQGHGKGADLHTAQKLAAGMLAGVASTLATYPLETMRTQISVNQGSGYSAIVRSLLAERGVRGLYAGFVPGLVNNSLTQALGFATYEGLSHGYRVFLNNGESPTTGERGLLGGASAFCVMTATMPLENVMRRMQVQGSPGYPVQYSSGLQCAYSMVRNEGVKSFWRGSLSSYMKVVPSIAAVRFLYEGIVAHFGIGGVRRYRMPGE